MHTMSLTDLVPGQLYQLQDKYTIMTEMLECPQPSMWTFGSSKDRAVFSRSEWDGGMLEMILLKVNIEIDMWDQPHAFGILTVAHHDVFLRPLHAILNVT